VIKKGEHGAMMLTEESVFVAQVFPTSQVKDTTGAGDAFLGGFCGQMARETKVDETALRRAVLCGTVMASIAVEHTGPKGLVDLTHEGVAKRKDVLRRVSAQPDRW